MSKNEDKPEVSGPTKYVGYGTPPEATRFKKGVSGNPRGRPKGSLNVAAVFSKTLRERVVINENGKRKTVTKLEAALKQLVNKAAFGDPRAIPQFVALARDAEVKQSSLGSEELPCSALDREVMDGILKRFLKANEPDREREPAEPQA